MSWKHESAGEVRLHFSKRGDMWHVLATLLMTFSLPFDAPFGYLHQCIWLCACEFVAVSLTVNVTLRIPHLPPPLGLKSLSTSWCLSVSMLLMPIPLVALLFLLS